MAKKKPPDAPKMLGLRLEVTEAERDELRIASATAGFRSMATYARHLVLTGMRAKAKGGSK